MISFSKFDQFANRLFKLVDIKWLVQNSKTVRKDAAYSLHGLVKGKLMRITPEPSQWAILIRSDRANVSFYLHIQ